MEQAEEMIEGRTQFSSHHFAGWQLKGALAVREDKSLGYGQALAGQPNDLVVQADRLCIPCQVEAPDFSGPVELA